MIIFVFQYVHREREEVEQSGTVKRVKLIEPKVYKKKFENQHVKAKIVTRKKGRKAR